MKEVRRSAQPAPTALYLIYGLFYAGLLLFTVLWRPHV